MRNFSNKALIAEIWLFEKDVLIFVVEGDEGAGDPACPPELCDGWEAGAEGEGVGAGEEEGVGERTGTVWLGEKREFQKEDQLKASLLKTVVGEGMICWEAETEEEKADQMRTVKIMRTISIFFFLERGILSFC